MAKKPKAKSQRSPPAYERDDGPLSHDQISALRKDAAKYLATGKLVLLDQLFLTTPHS